MPARNPRQSLKTTWLKGKLPEMNLVSFAHYFIDQLSASEYETLKSIAGGLHESTIPIGSTCSGLGTFSLCVKALFEAISQRFGVKINISAEFAVEIDPRKQQFLLSALGGSLRHLFADVGCFGDKEAFCIKEQRMVPIPSCFLLASSPSCVNLSGQRTDRPTYASCYEEEDNQSSSKSGETYKLGYKKASQTTQAKVSIYENVRDAAHCLKDQDGNPQKAATTVITEDLRDFDHTFEFSKLDTQNFLLPQRRERVWGSSCVGEDEVQYPLRMKMTMQRFQSRTRFPLSSILEDGLPTQELSGQRVQQQAKAVQKLCKEQNLSLAEATFDLSTSASRTPEWAWNQLTCVRPTHQIWNFGKNRRITPSEMLKSHGVFPDDFPHGEYLKNMDPTLAHDFAGNAFSTTVVIAKVLATIVNGNPWEELAKKGNYIPSTVRAGLLEECLASASAASLPLPSRTRKRKAGDQGGQGAEKKKKDIEKDEESNKGKGKRAAHDPQPDPSGDPQICPAPKKAAKRGDNKKGDVLTMKKKLDILIEFDKLKHSCKFPEKDTAVWDQHVILFDCVCV